MPYRWWLFSEFRHKVANRPPPKLGEVEFFNASPGPWGPGLCRDCHTIAQLAGAGTWRGLYRNCVPGRPGLRATLAGTKAGMSHQQNVHSRLCPRYSRDPRGREYSWYVHKYCSFLYLTISYGTITRGGISSLYLWPLAFVVKAKIDKKSGSLGEKTNFTHERGKVSYFIYKISQIYMKMCKNVLLWANS